MNSVKDSTLFTIRTKSDWELVSAGKSLKIDPFWFKYFVSENHSNDPVRLSFAISKKYGNAVKRNRLKRRFKETIRRDENRSQIPKGTFLLVGVKRNLEKPVSFSEVEAAISALIKRLKTHYE